MFQIKINNTTVEVEGNETILEAADKAGFHIPTMCCLIDFKASTSCMVCMVEDTSRGSYLASCSAIVQEGMEIITQNNAIDLLRKDALELLLSEHSGDCDALCQRVCPAGMDIPLMNRLIAQEQFDEALKVVKETIPIPTVLGYICPAPCENSCRRKDIDQTVSICALKRFVAEEDLKKESKYIPEKKEPTGKKAAVIGSGPMGLTTAYYLALEGFPVSIYDENELPGGKIRTEIPEEKLPKTVLDGEIQNIKELGVEFFMNRKIDLKAIKEELSEHTNLVVIAGGFECDIEVEDLVKIDTPQIKDLNVYRYNETVIIYPHIPVKKSLMSIRSVRTGLRIVACTKQVFKSEEVTAIPKRFNSMYTKLSENDKAEFLKESENKNQQIVYDDFLSGYSKEQAIQEAKRCLHCDCREKNNCLLRDLSDEYNAKQNSYVLEEAIPAEKIIQQNTVIYEPGKCIKCGICIQTAEKRNEDVGFTFIGRGFEVKIGFPLNNSIEKLVKETALECAQNCPTGSIALL